MTVLIFVIILGILVFVHELGHFLVAKKASVRVDEFGFGYPPRALKIGRKWGTLFTLNWIPFGGFVKIFGENYEPPSPEKSDFGEPREDLNFTQVSKKWQAGILVAGVTFNIVFAWLLFSLGFVIGLPTSVDNDFGAVVRDPALTIVGLVSDFPAQKSGLKTGDKIISVSNKNSSLENTNPEEVSSFINSSENVDIKVDRGGKEYNYKISPKEDVGSGRKIIGINMDMVGTLSLPIPKAIWEGGKTTLKLSYLTVLGIANLISDAVKGEADISEVTGPVGIVGLVGDASRLGFAYLITFTALISINLAVINLVPFPALDGGRILFVVIEGITKKKINPKVANILNTLGFALLITLMLIVTYRDILKLF